MMDLLPSLADFNWMKVSPGLLSLILLLSMFALLAIGMPLGFASAFLAVLVMMMKFGPAVLFGSFGKGPMGVLSLAIYRQMTNYVLISVPLFIFMAALLERSGIARDMYSSLNAWLSRTRGGIAFVTSIMAVIMAAMSGIIGGEVVLLGLIALPQMLRLGYNQNLAIGTICASGSLGTMIPPSIVLIFYGLITETSIKALFTASFLPGFMLASFFILYIWLIGLMPDIRRVFQYHGAEHKAIAAYENNVELTAGKGGQLGRSAGIQIQLLAKEGNMATLRLPSGEMRMVHLECMATIGQLGNQDAKNITLGKAGRKRWMGIKPTVRGVVMNPVDHPHGGGEGRAPIGGKPQTPWGAPAMGYKTRRGRKPSDKFIVKKRTK